MHFRYEERFRALQPGDINGAIALYGAAPAPSVVIAEGKRPETALDLPDTAGGRALGK
jgi:hypothetical protein